MHHRRVQVKGLCAAVGAACVSGAEQRSGTGPFLCAEGHTRTSTS